MSEEKVIYSVENGIAVIELNNTESLNALSPEVKSGLLTSLGVADKDPAVNIVVLTGKGRAFCAGGDVKGMGESTAMESVERISETTKITLKIANMNKVVIAAVNGICMGAGFSLALASDIVFVDENAKLGLKFTQVGLIPDCGLTYFLPKIVGSWQAKQLIFDGAVLEAEEAKELGFVNQICKAGTVVEEALAYANKLKTGPTNTYGFVKKIINQSTNQSLAEVINSENVIQSILQQTDDHKEGVLAFKEKRKPIFTGK